MNKRKPLIWQLYPSYLMLVLFALLATGFYASRSMRNFYLVQTRQDLLNQSRLLKDQFLPLLDPSRHAQLDQLCKTYGKRVPARLTVILPDGVVVGDSEAVTSQMENHGSRPEIMEALKGVEGSSTRFSATLRKRMMYVAIPIKDLNAVKGVVRVSIPLDAIDNELGSLQFELAIGAVVIALLASIVCLIISRRINKPIETMRQGAERYARGDLSHRLRPPSTFELAALAESMNKMARELERRIQAVINQRNETQAVLSSMVEGVVALDPDEKIMDLNAAAAHLFNRSLDELKGRSLLEIVRNRDLHRMVQITLVDGTGTQGDITLYHNGARVLSTRCTPLVGAQGDRLGILLVMNDVTQLRRLENMRSDFAANVSHEIKTPLTAIQGFVETLAHGSVENPEEARRFLGIIQKHVSRLATIIDDLMQLSRLEQDHETYRLKRSHGAMADVVRTAVQLCEKSMSDKNISAQVNVDGEPMALMDADLMEQAVVNLLDNAIKYSAAGSAITIDVAQSDNEIQVSVRDQGMGIARKHLPRLFERFYRVDKARSRKMGGTGLGLAIVKHIIQSHGGHVTVESVQGRGSAFTLHLPNDPAPSASGIPDDGLN